MTKFCTQNADYKPTGTGDAGYRRLIGMALRTRRTDAEALAMLPDVFTAETARQAWGYARANSAYTRLELLELAGAIEVFRYTLPLEKQGPGSRSTCRTWRKITKERPNDRDND